MTGDGIAWKVRAMSPPRFTTTEAAVLVGRSADSLARWRKNGVCQPSDWRLFGKVKVWLYTEEDIARMKSLSRTLKPGRKTTM